MHGLYQTGKSKGPNYDPQIGAAAQAQTAIAQQTLDFNKEYFTTYVAPLITSMTESTRQGMDLAAEQWAIQKQAALDNKMRQDFLWDRYLQHGVPAEDAYYEMVKEFSSEEHEEKMAGLALGDIRTAAAGQRQSTTRALQSFGIDPTSPAAVAAFSDMALTNIAAEAGAANRARQAAKELGMRLKMDAANFGRGGQSSVLAFGQAASNNLQAGFGGFMQGVQGMQGATGQAAGAGGMMNQGFGLAGNMYGQQMSTYGNLQGQAMQQRASNQAGFGQFLGTVAGAAIEHWSDERLKKNIVLVGEVPATPERGLFHLYTFDYLWEPDGTGAAAGRVGVLAQEIIEVIPEAVRLDAAGFYKVDYNALR